MKIKMYYNIFNKYSRNKVTNEDFNDLYQIIFNVYTYFANNSKLIDYCRNGAFKEEIKFYSNIIKDKVILFRQRKSKVFETYDINENIYNIILNLLNITFVKHIEKDLIFNDKFEITVFKNLELLLCLDYPNGFDIYFDQPIKDEHDTISWFYKMYNFNTPKKELYKFILGVILRKTSLFNIAELLKEECISSDDNIKQIELFYSLYIDKINFSIYPLLNDSINFNSDNNLFTIEKYIQNCCNNGVLILPDGVKKLDIDHQMFCINKIILNNDLKEMFLYTTKDIEQFHYFLFSMVIELPQKYNNLRINFVSDNKLKYLLLQEEFETLKHRILENVSQLVLPQSLLCINDSGENNNLLYKYLYSLFYNFFKQIERYVIDTSSYECYIFFSQLLDNLIIKSIINSENNHLTKHRVKDYYPNLYSNLEQSNKGMNNLSLEAAYKKAINDYIIRLNNIKENIGIIEEIFKENYKNK